MLRRHGLFNRQLHPMVVGTIKRFYLAGFSPDNIPTPAYIGKLNKFMFDIQKMGLVDGGTSINLEYLYFTWPDAVTVDFGRINIVRPSFAVATGTPSFVAKKGIGNGGTGLDTLFRLGDVAGGGNNLIMLPMNIESISMGCYIKEWLINAATQIFFTADGPNGRFFRLQHRQANNRMDGYLGVTSAAPIQLHTGPPASNDCYIMFVRSSIPGYARNGVEGSFGAGNSAPDTTMRITGGLAGTYVGEMHAGKPFGVLANADWNTAIQAFSSSL